MKCLARFKDQKYDFITHQEFSMTKHFSFETNESRRHFMKLMAGVGAGLAFSGTLDRKSTRLNSSHITRSRMPSSA